MIKAIITWVRTTEYLFQATRTDDLNLLRKIYSLRMLRCSHKQKKFLPMLMHLIVEVMIQKQRNM